jgi:Spy/CpxP family protein refolding chaperone
LPKAGSGPAARQLLVWLDAYLALELTETQLAELESILQADLPAIGETSRRLAEARRALVEETDPGAFDADAVRHFAVTQAPLYVELVVKTARTRAEMLGVLTSEQQLQLLAELDPGSLPN